MYRIEFTKQAIEDIALLRKSEPLAYRKVDNLIKELREHPTTGTGKPERLKGNRRNQWSRKITDKHRLVYMIEDKVLTVLLLAAVGHYGEK